MNAEAQEYLVELADFAIDYVKAAEGTIDGDTLNQIVAYYYEKSLQDYLIDREIQKAEKAKKEIAEALAEYWESDYFKSHGPVAQAIQNKSDKLTTSKMKQEIADTGEIQSPTTGQKVKAAMGLPGSTDALQTRRQAIVNQNLNKAEENDIALTSHPLHIYAHYLDERGGFDWSKCDEQVFDLDAVPREVINEINRRHGMNYYPHIHKPLVDIDPMGYAKSEKNLLETEMSDLHEVLHRYDYDSFQKSIYGGEHPIYAGLSGGASLTASGNEIPQALKQHIRENHGQRWNNHELEVPLIKCYQSEDGQYTGVNRVAYEKNLGVILPIAGAVASVGVDAAVKAYDAKLRRDADGTLEKLKKAKTSDISHPSAAVGVEKSIVEDPVMKKVKDSQTKIANNELIKNTVDAALKGAKAKTPGEKESARKQFKDGLTHRMNQGTYIGKAIKDLASFEDLEDLL